jgi:hypothetical protein
MMMRVQIPHTDPGETAAYLVLFDGDFFGGKLRWKQVLKIGTTGF